MSCWSEGFARAAYFVPGRDGMGVGQDSEILPAPSLTIWDFWNLVPGSVDYVELVDALAVYNASVSFLSKPS